MRFSHTLKQAAASSQYTSLMPCTLIVFILWAGVRWGKILMTEITIKQFIARAAFTSVMGSFVYLILFITSDSHWGIAEINFRTPFWAPSPQGHLQVLYFIIFDIFVWVFVLQWCYFNYFCKPNFAVDHVNKANVSYISNQLFWNALPQIHQLKRMP